MTTRKASLTPTDTMVYVHGKETYTLRQYCELYKHAIPGFVMVTQGYYGENEMEVMGSGQVLRIHSRVYQKRAVAVDSHNRTLSIPTNYPINFRVVNANNKVSKSEDSLSTILAKKGLPVNIQVSDAKKISFSLTTSVHNVQTLGMLTVREVYEETYFLANSLLSEIALYSPASITGSDNIYDYIEPSSYIVADWEGKGPSDETHAVTKPSLRRLPPPKPVKPPKPTTKAEEEDKPPALPVRLITSRSLQENTDLPKHQYANDIERATVSPFTQIAKDAAQKFIRTGVKDKDQGFTKGQADSVGTNEGDKPVQKLSIDELGLKLRELKLDKYMKTFKEHGVDGELAQDLNENILQEDFNFSKFESLKFMKFVRSGHVPK